MRTTNRVDEKDEQERRKKREKEKHVSGTFLGVRA